MRNESDFTSKKILIGLVAMSLYLTTASAAMCKTAEEAAYERAQEMIKGGHMDQASVILLQLYRKHPQNVGLLVELGETYFKDSNDMAAGLIKAEHEGPVVTGKIAQCREASAAPACGYASMHAEQQEKLLQDAFTV